MSNITKLVGERIRYIRKEKGFSQEELAHLASMHSTYVGQLERGEKNASLESIEKIAKALHVGIDELFRHIQPHQNEEESLALSRIVNRLQGRSLEEHEQILEFVDMLLHWKDGGK